MTTDLADRCEKATGPSDKLDGEIHQMRTGKEPFKGGRWSDTPHYTASLDAAMTLVPDEEWFPLLDSTDATEGRHYAELFGPEGTEIAKACAPTLPLALCAAALRARQS